MGILSNCMISAMATALFIYFLSTRARRLGLVDRSSSGRKVHDGEIPLVGGLAIFAGVFLSLWILQLNPPFEELLLPALLLIAIGVIDDRYELPYSARFSAQIIAGLMMTLGSGVVVYTLGDLLWPGNEILLNVASVPFTIICIVGLSNAFNMSDGMDGLAGTLSVVALFGLGFVAYLNGQIESAKTILLVSAAVVAFLCFNMRLPWRSRAQIFLGDAGSTLLGFLVTWFSVSLSQGEHAVIQPVTALWLVALPFFDIVAVIGRRIIRKQSPFEADREHLHHIFLLAGFSVGKTVVIMGVIATLLAGVGVGGLYLGVSEHIMFYLYLTLLSGYFLLTLRAWKVMKFMRRMVCRRLIGVRDRRINSDRRCPVELSRLRDYEGRDRRNDKERRSSCDRRTGPDRRFAPSGESRSDRSHGLANQVSTDRIPKIIFINRFYWPDHSATSQLLTDLATGIACRGVEVTVVTSRQRYDVPDADLPGREEHRKVSIRRVWGSRFGRERLLGRSLDYLSFYLSATWRVGQYSAAGDVVIVMTDPPLLSIPVGLAVRLSGASLVNWHQDLFPEIAGALRIRLMRGAGGSALCELFRALRDHLARSARLNIVLSREMAQGLQDRGVVPPEKIRIIPNWADGRDIVPLPTEFNALRREWGLQDQFVVGYSGNMGRVHQFDTILEAADRLRDEPNIVFLFIGGGHYRNWLEDEIKARGLENVRFKPYQPREHLSESLCVPDVHLISLRPAIEGLVVPSKFYGVLAAGRPTLYVGDTNSDIAYIVRKEGCGLAISEGDVQGLVATIVRLKKDQYLLSRMENNARELFERWYDFPLSLDRWCQALVDVGIQGDLLQPRLENLSGVLETNRGSRRPAVKVS